MTHAEWANNIRFRLEKLSVTNDHHAFEKLCMAFSRRRIASNLIPATGPVSAGGDQGRDFETFRTYIVQDTSARRFGRLASEAHISFACTTERNNLGAKIKADVQKTMCPPQEKAGPLPAVIFMFTVGDVRVSLRHSLQGWARNQFDIELHVFDGEALAEHLADPEFQSIVRTHLLLPTEDAPSGSILQILDDAHEVLNGTSDEYDIVATLGPSGPLITVEAKREDAEPALKHDFLFPDSPEGISAKLALQEHFRTGASVRIPGEYVVNIRVAESLKDILPFEQTGIETLDIGPRGAGLVFDCDLVAEIEGGETTVIPRLEMKVVQAGFEKVTLSNHHQHSPALVDLVVNFQSGSLNFSMKSRSGANVKQQLLVARFEQAISHGAILKFEQISSGMPLVSGPIAPGAWPEPSSFILLLMEKLLEIQQRTRLSFSLPDTITPEQARDVLEIAKIVSQGMICPENFTLTMPMSDSGARAVLNAFDQDPTGTLITRGTESVSMMLFGQSIDVGRCLVTAEGAHILNEDRKLLEQALIAATPDDVYEVKVRVPTMPTNLIRYERWLPATDQDLFFPKNEPAT